MPASHGDPSLRQPYRQSPAPQGMGARQGARSRQDMRPRRRSQDDARQGMPMREAAYDDLDDDAYMELGPARAAQPQQQPQQQAARRGLGALPVTCIAVGSLLAGLGGGFALGRLTAPHAGGDAAQVADGGGGSSLGSLLGGSQGGSASAVRFDASGISQDWSSGEIVIGEKGYRLGESTYGDLIDGGWRLTDADAEDLEATYGGKFILNPGAPSTAFTFQNDSLGGFSGLTACFQNLGSEAADFRDCEISYLAIRASYVSADEQAPAVTLPAGVALGADADAIAGAYGPASDVYEATDSTGTTIVYTQLTYDEAETGVVLDMTVYPEGGLKDITMSK